MAESMPLITANGSRTECIFCSCGFKQNPLLFPDITSEKVRMALRNINDQKAIHGYLVKSGIHIRKDTDSIIFPEGVCQSVRRLLLNKIQELGVEVDDITGLGYYAGWRWEEELSMID